MTHDTGTRGRHHRPAALTTTSPPAPWQPRPVDGWRDRLGSLLGDRQALPPGALRGLLVLLVVGLVLGLVYLWLARPVTELAPPLQRTVPPVAVGGPGAAPSAATSAAAPLVVDVVGAVRRPGVVELPGGSRVRDAVEAAGGPTAKARLASVNLARLLVDGEQLLVLRRGQGVLLPGAAGPAASRSAAGMAPSAGPAVPLDLNAATADQLDALPGIGPVLAQRIIEWRSQHGRFGSVEELTDVSGIGTATLDDLRDRVRV